MLVYRCYNSVHLYHISHDDDEKAQIYFIQENFFSKELQVNIPEETVQRCLDQIAFGEKKIPLKFEKNEHFFPSYSTERTNERKKTNNKI